MDEKEVSEMQEEMMTVLVVEPMKAPYVKNIPNELEDLQQAVGGDIEMTYPFDDNVTSFLRVALKKTRKKTRKKKSKKICF